MHDKIPSGAREGLLRRLREINGAQEPEVEIVRQWAALPRAYDVAGSVDEESRLQRLAERLCDYGAEVHSVTPGEIASTAGAILQSLGLAEVLVPKGLAPEWLPTGIRCVEDRNFLPHELDRFVAVFTRCTMAIAETGTLVLQSDLGQGRRAVTLVPDVHLCVLRAEDVVGSVPEAVRRLQATATSPTTFVSGPSATADIEMTRIKGVHGPRFLHVLLVRSC